MSKYTGLVRLLNPSIYETSDIKAVKYPVIVEAELCTILKEYADVSPKALSELLGRGLASYSLTWFNPMSFEQDRVVSWEHYTPNPFEQWNKLKESREVGSMPHKEIIYR